MSRAKWKASFVARFLLKKEIKKISKPITIWCRSSVIPEFLLNKKVLVHNGKTFRPFYIKNTHCGLKFGEFSFTRKLKKIKTFKKNIKKSKK